MLLGEALNVLLEGLARPSPAIAQIPRVTRLSVGTLEVPDEGRVEVGPAPDSSHALAKLD